MCVLKRPIDQVSEITVWPPRPLQSTPSNRGTTSPFATPLQSTAWPSQTENCIEKRKKQGWRLHSNLHPTDLTFSSFLFESQSIRFVFALASSWIDHRKLHCNTISSTFVLKELSHMSSIGARQAGRWIIWAVDNYCGCWSQWCFIRRPLKMWSCIFLTV